MVSNPLPDLNECLNNYKRLRIAGQWLNNTLTQQVSKTALMECAKKLGLLKGKVLLLGGEDELTIVFDYCLFNYRREDKNIIQRYFEQHPPSPGSDEMILLQGMLRSHYSVFRVQQTYPGRGAILSDLTRLETLLLMDVGISSTAKPDQMFAGRVLPLGDYYMTSGTFLPITPEISKAIMPILVKFLQHRGRSDERLFSPAQEAALSAQIIRVALRSGVMEKMRYHDVTDYQQTR